MTGFPDPSLVAGQLQFPERCLGPLSALVSGFPRSWCAAGPPGAIHMGFGFTYGDRQVDKEVEAGAA